MVLFSNKNVVMKNVDCTLWFGWNINIKKLFSHIGFDAQKTFHSPLLSVNKKAHKKLWLKNSNTLAYVNVNNTCQL